MFEAIIVSAQFFWTVFFLEYSFCFTSLLTFSRLSFCFLNDLNCAHSENKGIAKTKPIMSERST